jgi:murein DD-endopeptidase MepM/ murein hydrolase activator NlpD
MARPLGDPGWSQGWSQGRRKHQTKRWRPEIRRWIGPLVLIAIAGTAFALLIGGLPSSASIPGDSPSPSAAATTVAGTMLPTPSAPGARPSPTVAPVGASASPPASPAAQTPSATGTPGSAPTASAMPDRPPGAAPAGPDEFDTEAGVVIDIAFPFKEGVRYRYRDNWLHERPGPPKHYNHVRLRRGNVVRAHDGIDVYARPDTPVVAPFAGEVIEPAVRWQPWLPERYGATVVIVSREPQSEGYVAVLSHLAVAFVEPGDSVRRGEVIGLNGDSGNAEGGPAHLHFELRAPFVLEWDEAGETRLVDAFNPYPSLRAADPAAAD